MTSITLPISDEGSLGPAMLVLTSERMRAFVVAMLSLDVKSGLHTYAEAASAAGYEGTRQSLTTTGYRLAHDERIQAAMLEEGKRMLSSTVPFGINVLRDFASDPTLDAKDRMKAITMIFNRAGLPEVSEQKITVTRTLSEADKIKSIIEIATALGMDPRALLGDAAPPSLTAPVATIEAEDITEVSDGSEFM